MKRRIFIILCFGKGKQDSQYAGQPFAATCGAFFSRKDAEAELHKIEMEKGGYLGTIDDPTWCVSEELVLDY